MLYVLKIVAFKRIIAVRDSYHLTEIIERQKLTRNESGLVYETGIIFKLPDGATLKCRK